MRKPKGPALLGFAVAIFSTLLAAAPAATLTLSVEDPTAIDDATYANEVIWIYKSAPTYVEPGAVIRGPIHCYQFSRLEISGGSIRYSVRAYTASRVNIFGGEIEANLEGFSSARIALVGGQIRGPFQLRDRSTLTIVGSDFRVDGVPVPYGPLAATSGTLSGTLDSGDALLNAFLQGGAVGPDGQTYGGTIELVAEIPDDLAFEWPPPGLINNGAENTIDDDTYADLRVTVRTTTLGLTRVNVVPDAVIGRGLSSFDSVLRISGGEIGFADGSILPGGTAYYPTSSLAAFGSDVLMTDGAIAGRGQIDNSSMLEMSGGSFGSDVWLRLQLGSSLAFAAGHVAGDVTLAGESSAAIAGGCIGGRIASWAGSTLEIRGYDFRIDGRRVPFGRIDRVAGTLIGILESGEIIESDFEAAYWDPTAGEWLHPGNIELVPAGEFDDPRKRRWRSFLGALRWWEARGEHACPRPLFAPQSRRR
jgi:hypothetical protein